jgi:hypothetical protein
MSRPAIFSAAALLTACPMKDRDYGDTGAEASDNMPYCEEEATALASADEVTAIGVSGADLLGRLPPEGGAAGVARWANGAEASATTVSVAVDLATLSFIDAEAVYPDDGGPTPAIGVECPDAVAVDAVVSIVSDDGLLNESWSVQLRMTDAAAGASFFTQLEADGFGGSVEVGDFADLSRFDEVSASASGEFGPTGFWGDLSAQGEGSDGDGPDGTAYAEMIAMATFEPVVSAD